MLVDLHIHTSGISPCSHRTPEEIIAQCLADDTGGFVLTNHCAEAYMRDVTYRDWCVKYNNEFYHAKRLGDKYGVRVFFGVEVNTSVYRNIHYLIYGIQPCDLLCSPELYKLTQEELYEYCENNGFLLYQAHPYRNGAVPQNPDFLHGVEINCHPIYKFTMEREVCEFAEKNKLRLSCGSDFHGDSYKARCGAYLPDDITTEKELVEYLRNNQPELEVFDIINVE